MHGFWDMQILAIIRTSSNTQNLRKLLNYYYDMVLLIVR